MLSGLSRAATAPAVARDLGGGLALAAIVGVNELGPALFEALGVVCGVYLVWLGGKAVLTGRNVKPVPKHFGATPPPEFETAFTS